jgi:hypothetical protein
MKKCSIFLATREMQITTTLRFCLICLSMAISRQQKPINSGEDVGKRNLIHCGWEYKLVQLVWSSVWK